MQQVFTYLIETFGAFGAILIIIGSVGWILIKELKKSNESLIEKQHMYNIQMTDGLKTSITQLSEKLTDDMRQQNKQLVEYLLNNDIHKQDVHNQNLKDRHKITKEIDQMIDDLRISVDGLRVCVLEFHNSSSNQTGLPFLKFSLTSEKISKGCKIISPKYQNVQFSAILTVAERVLESENHIYVLNNKDEIDEIAPIMVYDGRSGLNGALFKGLFHPSNNELIGLLCIEFPDSIPNDIDETNIISIARTVSGLVTLKNEL